jgi:gamma-glutamylaminecyclotransferase
MSAGGPVIAAWAYLKSRELATPVHRGWLEDYQDRRFIRADMKV